MITSGVRVRLPGAVRPNAVAPLAGRGMQVNTAAVPARRRRRGTRLSPLDPFFGMDMISPYLDEERIAGSLASSTRHMAIDIVEDESAFVVKADVPGVKKEDIGIDVDGDHISISVRQSSETETEDKNKDGITFHRMERSSEFISRTFHMPENADMESIDAAYSDGVLTLKISKKSPNGNAKRQIAVQ